MPSVSSFLLGLVVASVLADKTTSEVSNSTDGDTASSATISRMLNTTVNATISDSINASATTMSNDNLPAVPTVTPHSSTPAMFSTIANNTTRNVSQVAITTAPFITLRPYTPQTTTKQNTPKSTPASSSKGNDNTGIIILILILLVAVGFLIACLYARKRARRYSVDFTSRPDEATIPLSTIDPEQPVDAAPQNGLRTFESPEDAAKEQREPEEEPKPETQDVQKAETDKPAAAADTNTESAAPAPDSSEDKPNVDVTEQSPPAPAEPQSPSATVEPQSPPAGVDRSPEEKTDDEGAASNKTSVESLKETNENNSNNADFGWRKDMKTSITAWELSPDFPV